ncbi:MAG: polysaccharide deacetylase family protein [Gammaproteobacteria bacterium]|nr:polysaccharide deacetylase family protein [Gammaproteobacteria bacterium]
MRQSVPVLLYHHVLPEGSNTAIKESLFVEQMRFLTENGWHTLSADEFLAFKKGRGEIPRKSVLLTFDDGWLDNYLYAWPVLQRFGHKAIVFLVTEWVENASKSSPVREIGWKSHQEAMLLARTSPRQCVLHLAQIQEMSDSVSFESHTHRHISRKNNPIDFKEDLQKSQEFFVSRLGKTSRHLCYPWGYYEPGDERTAGGSGFEACYTVKSGTNAADGKLSEIKRFSVKNNFSSFRKKLFIFNRPLLADLYGKFRKQ